MRRIILISLVCQLSLTAAALNFFGIEYNGNTADNIANLIYSMAQGDEAAVREYTSQLEKTDPELAKKLKPDELKIPCANCQGKGMLADEQPCSVCEGTGLVADARSLGYLQYKFCAAIEAGRSEERAWKSAKAAFDERRAVVLQSVMLEGTVIRKEEGGALLCCGGDDESVYLKGIGGDFPGEGSSVSGEVWMAGMHLFTGEDGSPVEIKCYTVNLWMD
jgi:hypothetical protein